MTPKNTLPYLIFKNSLKRTGKPWSELRADEQDAPYNDAEHELQLQQAILRSPEASTISLERAGVEQAFQTIRNRFPSKQAFIDNLNNEGLTPNILRDALEDELRVDAIMTMVASRAQEPSKDEINTYYHAHQNKFQTPETRSARHILITINPDFPKNTRENALARIEDLHQQLQTAPAKFPNLAKQHSECPTALKGGELGDIRPGKLYPQLESALFSLSLNEISPPIETEMGFHLITCEAIHPATTMPKDQAAEKINQILHHKKQQKLLQQWLEKLNTELSI